MTDTYPDWAYFPRSEVPPDWVGPVTVAFKKVRAEIDSSVVQGLKSDGVLGQLADGLVELGFEVESGKQKADRIRRPVLYGNRGSERVSYEIDAWHDEFGIVVEVEAGRAMMGNAVYRDLVRASLIVGARFLVLAVMSEYRYRSGARKSRSRDFESAEAQLDAVYSSGRLQLPFDGVLLVGY